MFLNAGRPFALANVCCAFKLEDLRRWGGMAVFALCKSQAQHHN